MIPIIETFTSNTALSSSSLEITKPSGVTPNDLLLLIVGNDDSTNTQQFDTFTEGGRQWTLIREQGNAACDCHIAAFYRISDGTEGASVVIPAQSADDIYGWCLRVSGARHIGSPIHKYGQVNTTSGSSHVFLSLETVFRDCLVFGVFSYDGGDSSSISVSGTNWSKQDELKAGTGSSNASGAWAKKDMASPGDSEDVTFTTSLGDGGSGFQFAISREGAPPVEIKDAILRKLDDVWENRGPEVGYASEGEFITIGSETFYVHSYDKIGDRHTYVRIKDKTPE
jgi:hypothetical protein